MAQLPPLSVVVVIAVVTIFVVVGIFTPAPGGV